MRFHDRLDAGTKLARALIDYRHADPVVVGLARGGVVPAAAVARALEAPLEIIVARKIGHPWAPEYAIGAVSETGSPVWNEAELLLKREPSRHERADALQAAARQASRRYAAGRLPLSLRGRTVILVDDGIATGLTMAAAAGEARRRGARTLVVAVPVAPFQVRPDLEGYADDIVILIEPSAGFQAVGQFYEHFEQVSDDTVIKMVGEHAPVQETIDLPALSALIQDVDQFPVSSGTLVSKARQHHSPPSVVQFFESIPTDVTFASPGDLLTRSAEAGLLMEEEQDEPPDGRVYPGD